MIIDQAQQAEKSHKITGWSSAWAFIKTTWVFNESLIVGQIEELSILEEGKWRSLDS